MAIEIERKFLVHQNLLPKSSNSLVLEQAYLNDDPSRLVRVRIAGDEAFLTIKGKGIGFSRPEFEYEIPIDDARELIEMAIYPPIKKIRHIILYKGKKWEVDIFSGANNGLIIAEVELDSEQEQVVLPEWIEKEVTGDKRFFNYQLSIHPFTTW